MEVLGINSSPRKRGNTARLMAAVLKGAEDGGCEVTDITLSDYEIRFCLGCEACYRTGSCVQSDDYADILEMILSSDGIVLASPNYINNVTARMKALFDRMGDCVHCQRMSGKYGAAVSTAGGSGAGDVAGYLNHTLSLMGADVVGAASVNLSEGPDAFNLAIKESHNLGMALAETIVTGRVFPDQKAGHEEMMNRMRELVSLRSDDWAYEYAYFRAKKWL